MGSAGIGNHAPFLGLVGSVDEVGVAAVGALLAVEVAAVGAVGAAGDRPGAGAGLGRVAFAVQHHHHPGTEGRVILGAADPLGQLPTRPGPDRELAVVEGHKHWVQAQGGQPAATLAGRLIARWRIASGLRAGMPSPCRWKALRSDGQVVPSSARPR